jgi:hypothetical protein
LLGTGCNVLEFAPLRLAARDKAELAHQPAPHFSGNAHRLGVE